MNWHYLFLTFLIVGIVGLIRVLLDFKHLSVRKDNLKKFYELFQVWIRTEYRGNEELANMIHLIGLYDLNSELGPMTLSGYQSDENLLSVIQFIVNRLNNSFEVSSNCNALQLLLIFKLGELDAQIGRAKSDIFNPVFWIGQGVVYFCFLPLRLIGFAFRARNSQIRSWEKHPIYRILSIGTSALIAGITIFERWGDLRQVLSLFLK